MCSSGDVNVFQWNREWFFSRRLKFHSGFDVMAVFEDSWHGPKVVYRFTGIRIWVLRWWKRPFWFSKKVTSTLSLNWSREWFFSRRLKFDSGLNVMAVYEVSWHGPKVIYRFTGIRIWVLRWWKRPFWFSKKVTSTLSLNWSMPYQGGCSQFLISSRKFDSSICDCPNCPLMLLPQLRIFFLKKRRHSGTMSATKAQVEREGWNTVSLDPAARKRTKEDVKHSSRHQWTMKERIHRTRPSKSTSAGLCWERQDRSSDQYWVLSHKWGKRFKLHRLWRQRRQFNCHAAIDNTTASCSRKEKKLMESGGQWD